MPVEPTMSQSLHAMPQRYTPSLEIPEKDEAETAAQLNETMRGIQETTYEEYGHALRSVHAKSHGLLEGELRVLDGLAATLAQGLFSRPATYPVVLRFSTNPGDILDDSVSAPRGAAIKIIGVEGERLPGSEGDATQDFIMVNAPAFAAPNTAAFAKNLKLLAATTDTGQGWKKVFSAALRGTETALEAAGGKSPMLTTMGGQPLTHPLGDTYFTQVPFRHGDYVAKLSLAPVSPELKALTDRPVDVSGRPNALREEVIDFFRRHSAEWELRVQLRTNPDTMPIEDASVVWPEDESPYLPVARITVARQPAWSEARAAQVDDGLSFSPWHGLLAHQPLGSINRARKDAYADAAEFRFTRNGCPLHEPEKALSLSREPARKYGSAPGREGRRPGTPDAPPGQRGQAMDGAGRAIAVGAAGALLVGAAVAALMRWRNSRNRHVSLMPPRRLPDRFSREPAVGHRHADALAAHEQEERGDLR
jgi:hypothetical protein